MRLKWPNTACLTKCYNIVQHILIQNVILQKFDALQTMFPFRTTSEAPSPDQLKDVVDETGPVVAAEHCVILLELTDQSVPASRLIVDNIIPPQVHIEFNPLYLLWQVQHICRHTVRSQSKLENMLGRSFFNLNTPFSLFSKNRCTALLWLVM